MTHKTYRTDGRLMRDVFAPDGQYAGCIYHLYPKVWAWYAGNRTFYFDTLKQATEAARKALG